MTDEEFLATSTHRAIEVLRHIGDAKELDRLIRLYRRRYWFSIGADTVHDLKRRKSEKSVERLEQFSWEMLREPGDANETNPAAVINGVATQIVQTQPPAHSDMRLLGMCFLFAGLVCSAVAWIVAFGTDDLSTRIPATLVAWGFGSVAGLGAFMWMLGIIEQRLIEIRTVLSEGIQKTAI